MISCIYVNIHKRKAYSKFGQGQPNFGRIMAPFLLRIWENNVQMMTQEIVDGSKQYFAHMYTTIKGMPSSNPVTPQQILSRVVAPFLLRIWKNNNIRMITLQ